MFLRIVEFEIPLSTLWPIKSLISLLSIKFNSSSKWENSNSIDSRYAFIVKFDLFGVLNSTIDKINSKKYITKKDLELYKESDVATLGFFMTKYLLYTNLCKIIIDKVFQIQKILDKKVFL